MGFNRFVLNIITRSVLIAINALLIAFFYINVNWAFTFIFLCLIFILQILFLIRYSTKINRDLANFLIHIKEQDTTLAFSSKSLDKTFSGLTNEFKRINKEFQKLKAGQIQKQNLLNLLLDRVDTGIIVLNNTFEVKLINNAIRRIFDLDDINNPGRIWGKIRLLIQDIDSLKTGDQKIEVIHVNNISRKILISLSIINENNENLKVYSFHDIDREMTDYELQSWNGLIKVLSHEIMNTLTPMSTVVDTIKDCITIDGIEKEIIQLNKKDLTDSAKAINLMANRVNSLKSFIAKFRTFSDIPTPELKDINLHEYINLCIDLYKNNYPFIRFTFEPQDNNMIISADNDLLNLVFNNIIKNAAESFSNKENPEIKLNTGIENDSVFVKISDNGSGIDPSVLRKVFLPFFTTKKEGSGIGLSLSRQIMYLHKGNIEIKSNNSGTSVRLTFKTKH